MAAMKPRTGDGPLEVSAEGRGIVVRIPTEGGGRLVIEMSAQEAAELGASQRHLNLPTKRWERETPLSHRCAVCRLLRELERGQRLTATASPSPTGRSAEANSSELRR